MTAEAQLQMQEYGDIFAYWHQRNPEPARVSEVASKNYIDGGEWYRRWFRVDSLLKFGAGLIVVQEMLQPGWEVSLYYSHMSGADECGLQPEAQLENETRRSLGYEPICGNGKTMALALLAAVQHIDKLDGRHE